MFALILSSIMSSTLDAIQILVSVGNLFVVIMLGVFMARQLEKMKHFLSVDLEFHKQRIEFEFRALTFLWERVSSLRESLKDYLYADPPSRINIAEPFKQIVITIQSREPFLNEEVRRRSLELLELVREVEHDNFDEAQLGGILDKIDHLSLAISERVRTERRNL